MIGGAGRGGGCWQDGEEGGVGMGGYCVISS